MESFFVSLPPSLSHFVSVSRSWLGQEPDTSVPNVIDEYVSKTHKFNTTYDIPPVVHLGELERGSGGGVG